MNAKRTAFKFSLLFVIAGWCWDFLSDDLLKWLIRNPELREGVDTILDALIVVLAGWMLYQLLSRWLTKWDLDMKRGEEAEIARLASEERYRQIFAVESDAIMLVDGQTNQILEVNPAAERMYGFSMDEFLGLKATDISAEPEKTTQAIASDAKHVPARLHRRKDGTVFPVEITCGDFAYQNRKLHVAAMRDITERKRAEAALDESATRYRSLFENMNEGVAYCRMIFEAGKAVDFIYLAVNEMFVTLTGLKQVAGKRVTEVIPGIREQDPKLFEFYGRVAATGKPEKAERYVEALQMWFDLSVYSTEQDCFVVVFDVITKRKRIEQAMKLQFTALNAAANAIVITDAKGQIEWVNPAFSKLTGYSAEEVIGRDPSFQKSGHHPPGFYANMWATAATGNFWHGELVNKRKDGSCYTEDMTITPVRDAENQIAHFVAIKQDVTEQRELANRLQQAQKMEAIGTLAGGIAHDFNNILAAMFGYGYLLQHDTEGNPAAQESIEQVLLAANRAKDLVQQILTFSRQRENKREVIRLDTVVNEAMKFLRASLPAEIAIEKTLDADTPAVLADATQIYQVTLNLATNALHAMEGRPGRLAVSLAPFLPDEKFVQTHREFRSILYARLAVSDTGHGMDARTLERIFEPFFTTKPVGKGTGLGLSVVHGIVQSHEGILTVTSQPGQGTTFYLYFPAKTQAAPAANAANGNLSRGHGQKILLVDDDPALTGMFQRLLCQLDYQVASYNSPSEAVRLFREKPAQFDLAITDLTMPEMNGLSLARQLHAIRPELPVLLTSGTNSALTDQDLREAGILELLEKPVSIACLAEVVQRTLAQS
jgi:PAS domain S-box-containing protein